MQASQLWSVQIPIFRLRRRSRHRRRCSNEMKRTKAARFALVLYFGDGIFHCPLENIVVLLHPSQYSLFSHSLTSLLPPPAALRLAPPFPPPSVIRFRYTFLQPTKKGHLTMSFFVVLYRLNRCHPKKVNKIKGVRYLSRFLSASLIDANLNFNKIWLKFSTKGVDKTN